MDWLFVIGNKLVCYFTLEYTSYELAGHLSRIYSNVTNETSIPTVQIFMSHLRQELPGFNIEQDSKEPRIIHIIEQSLATNQNYVLNQRISLKYAGELCGCDIMDASGKRLTSGKGLVDSISTEIEGLATGYDEQGALDDCQTRVKINAVNETLRNILSEGLPLE